jgi:hypothetical protein
MDIEGLQNAIVSAKRATYVGGGETVAKPCRLGSHDIAWSQGEWRYLDSYFGGSDFSGQEVMWLGEEPVWAMSYFGYIIHPDRIDAARAGAVIKSSLASLYDEEKRFLGGFRASHAYGVYIDENDGDIDRFTGREIIEVGGVEAYALVYHGGLIRH